MLHFSFTSTSYIRAFSRWNVLWWGHRKSAVENRWAEETRSFIAIFLSLSYTVSSCCRCQRMLIQIATDKTVAYTPFIDVSLMKHVHVTACMKRAEFSKLKDSPIHTQVLNVFQATGQYSVLSLSLHVRLCKCVQKITWADGNQQWIKWMNKIKHRDIYKWCLNTSFFSICNQVSNPC